MHVNLCKTHKLLDDYICQNCARIFCAGCNPPTWIAPIPGLYNGNVCCNCKAKLAEYCQANGLKEGR